MTKDPRRWESLVGFVVVLAVAVTIVLALWLLSQFFELDPDDA